MNNECLRCHCELVRRDDQTVAFNSRVMLCGVVVWACPACRETETAIPNIGELIGRVQHITSDYRVRALWTGSEWEIRLVGRT